MRISSKVVPLYITMPPKKVQIQRTGISSCYFFFFKLKTSSVKNASCDSDTSDIDIVNEETHNGMVFEEHTLSVNNCDYY